MNTRLSMPSTISIELNVNSRIHTCGSASNSQLINRIPSTVVRIIPASRHVPAASRPARHQDHSPAPQHLHTHHKHRGPSHALRAPGTFAVLVTVAPDTRLAHARQIAPAHPQP